MLYQTISAWKHLQHLEIFSFQTLVLLSMFNFKVKGDEFRGQTGRVEFDSNGRRKNVNITILEMSQDGILEVRFCAFDAQIKGVAAAAT